jgi:hypothetical protein
MRVVVWVLATLVAGCDESGGREEFCGNGRLDISEECEPSGDFCPDCRLPLRHVTAHWSFETLDGALKSPCLPGDPEVKVYAQGGYTLQLWESAPCADGQVQLAAKREPLFVWVTSATYMSRVPSRLFTPSPTGDLPTIVIYTDAGDVRVRWDTQDAAGFQTSCSEIGVGTVRLVADGTPVPDGEAPCTDLSLIAGPILAGTRSLRVEGLSGGTVIAASSPIDITVSPGARVDAFVVLQALTP